MSRLDVRLNPAHEERAHGVPGAGLVWLENKLPGNRLPRILPTD